MENLNNKTKKCKKNLNKIQLTADEYLHFKLMNNMESGFFQSLPNNPEVIFKFLFDYILENFTLDELHIIFFYRQDMDDCLSEELVEFNKSDSIININNHPDLSNSQKLELTEKVSNMPLVLYALMMDFLGISDLFLLRVDAEYNVCDEDDEDYEYDFCYMYPDLDNVKVKQIKF